MLPHLASLRQPARRARYFCLGGSQSKVGKELDESVDALLLPMRYIFCRGQYRAVFSSSSIEDSRSFAEILTLKESSIVPQARATQGAISLTFQTTQAQHHTQ